MVFKKMVIDLYRVKKAGMVWKRVQRDNRDRERLLQKALQKPENQRILGGHVHWIGREFAHADFFGIDEKWNIVFVETKVTSQQLHLAKQLHKRVGGFVGMAYRDVDNLIWEYIRKHSKGKYFMDRGIRLNELAKKGRIKCSKDVAAVLQKKIRGRRPAKVRRVKFIAVSPYMNDKFARRLQILRTNLRRRLRKGRRGRVSFSCVLLTPYLKKQVIAVARIDF